MAWMRWWTELKTRVRAVLGRRRMEEELDEELAFHLERETEKLISRGMPPEAARREARRRFGGVDRHRDEARAAWGTRWLHDLGQDLRLGLRRMRKSPGFTTLAALTLALGVGGTVALFSVVHGLLLRPLPVEDADRLHVFWSEYNWRGAEVDHVRGVTDALDMAAYTLDGSSLRRGEETRYLQTGLVTAELFDVLGARPLLGRTFHPGEDRPGAERVALLSYGLWQQELGGDPGVLGQRLVLDGEPTTVIGVMPSSFWFPTPETRIWRPLAMDPADSRYANTGWLVVVGRLTDGHGEAAIPGALDAITTALGEAFTYSEQWDKTRGAHLTPFRAYLFGDIRPVVLLLMGAVVLLLLMAVTNVSSLLLTRTADRGGEMGLRTALGAGRGRLVRQVVTEAGLLGLAAGVAGVGLARLAFPALVAALPLDPAFADTLELRWDLLGAALGVAVLAGTAAALAPSLRLLAGRLPSLRPGMGGSRGAGGGPAGSSRIQSALVAGQVVTAVLLVTGASLFIRSVGRLHDVELGLDPGGVAAVDVSLDAAGLEPGAREAVFEELLQRARATPGVAEAAVGIRLPVRDDGIQGGTLVESAPGLRGPDAPNSYWRAVTPGYFETLGMRLVAGRAFDDGDAQGAVQVAVVNERFARDMWPGDDPIGQRVQGTFDQEWATVVGVVGDVRLQGPRGGTPRILYRPWAQWQNAWTYRVLMARTSGDAGELTASLRATAEAVHPGMVAVRTATLEGVVDASMGDALRLRFFLSLLAGLALVVGGAGIYGVVSYAVTRRRGEYGVRQALGAGGGRLVGEVLGRALRPVAAGVVVGGIAALLLARLAAGLVYEIAPRDPVSMVAGVAFLMLTGVAAALVPALRASRVAPAEALRSE